MPPDQPSVFDKKALDRMRRLKQARLDGNYDEVIRQMIWEDPDWQPPAPAGKDPETKK